MSPLGNTHVVGYCSFCQEWLGNPAPEEVIASSEWEMWVSSQIGGLIGSVSVHEQDPDVETMRGNIRALVQALGGGYMVKLAKQLGAQKSTCSLWLNGKTLPSLDYWLRMTWISGIDLNRLILFSITSEEVLVASRSAGSTTLWGPRPLRSKHDWIFAEQRLGEIYRVNETPPRTMRQLAKELGVDREEMKARFPELYQVLSQRSLQHQSWCRARWKRAWEENIEQAVATLVNRDCVPTRRMVARELQVPSGDLRDRRLESIWQSCVAKLHGEP